MRHTCRALQPSAATRRPARRSAGFTLVELLIAMVIIGVLATVALPAFNDAVRKSRRSDALTSLAAVQQAQERWRSNHAAYATQAQLTLPAIAANDGDPVGLGLSATTSDGYYSVTISGDGPSGYMVTAAAVAGTSQAKDTGCQLMAVRLVGGNLSYGSGATSLDWTDPGRCWAR